MHFLKRLIDSSLTEVFHDRMVQSTSNCGFTNIRVMQVQTAESHNFFRYQLYCLRKIVTPTQTCK